MRVTIPVADVSTAMKHPYADCRGENGRCFPMIATPMAVERLIRATFTDASATERGAGRMGVEGRLRRLIVSSLGRPGH